MKDVKVVIFDCDGVMFDSTKANTAYYNTILKHFNKGPMTAEQFDYVHMHTVYAALEYLFNNEGERKAALTLSRNMDYEAFIPYMDMEPDLKPLLDWLRPDIKTAVATNRTTTIGRVIAEHNLDGYFDMVVSALDVDHPKPSPDMLIKIIDHFNMTPIQAIYVGDSALDEAAAKAAGIPLVAYKNTSLSAAFHVNSLKDIPEIINNKCLMA